MGALEIEAFLSHLAQEANVSASTQNQAFNALLFLYRNVLQIQQSRKCESNQQREDEKSDATHSCPCSKRPDPKGLEDP
jgi:hypothetical protein